MAMKNRPPIHRAPPEAVEVELIRTLFHAFMPSAVMTLGFAVVGLATYERTGDAMILALLIIGLIASTARLGVAWALVPDAARTDLTLAQAHRLERLFAVPYLAFACVLGLFGMRALLLPVPDVHMMTMTMLMGYCAGVAVGMGLRLWIAIPAMLIAFTPAVIAALFHNDIVYAATSCFTTAILLGGARSLHHRHDRAVKDIGLRLAFATLARKDALTALPNRIALREWYEECVAHGQAGMIAVHYIDLNGFKPVNDSYGHPVGDLLLAIVGKRIARTIRSTDIAARLGGDEFAVIQYDLKESQEAERLATRLSEAIARPYRIGPRIITISTGLGYVVADGRDDEDLDHLLGLADEALYASKRAGVVQQYEAVEAIQQRAVA